jgi:hypothetical protein
MTTIVLAICCAAIAACCFAGAAALQHGAVRVCMAGQSLGLRALRQMVRSRRWQAGTGLAVTGSGLHVTALSQAPLVIVQPIGVLSLVVTVLLGSRVAGGSIGPVVRGAVTCVCAATGGFVALTAVAGTSTTGSLPVGPVLLVVAAAGALTVLGFGLRGRIRCLAISTASALMFGSGSAVIRTATLIIGDSVAAGLGLAVLATVLMIGGGWAQHQAYASGPPSLVIATTTVVDPLTAVAIGIGIYGETASIPPAMIVAELILALLAGAAVIVLARALPRDKPTPTPVPQRVLAPAVGVSAPDA